VTIARTVSSRGNRGEVAAEAWSSHPERFEQLREVHLFGGGQPAGGSRFQVERVWRHRGRVIFKFRGVDSISDAERLRGAEVRIPKRDRLRLPAGEYYLSDLVGCEVVDGNGRPVGRLRGWQEHGGPVILEVEAAGTGEEILIPFAADICTGIDVAARRIRVNLPEGLEELNR